MIAFARVWPGASLSHANHEAYTPLNLLTKGRKKGQFQGQFSNWPGGQILFGYRSNLL
jgi:hypothetical protein